jgi:hypothetical protein
MTITINLSVTPRIAGDRNGLTATTAWKVQFLMLGAACRQARVDRVNRVVTIDDRNWWFRRRIRIIVYDEVEGVTYGYEDSSWSRNAWAHDPTDRFVVGLKLKSGEEVPLFNFVGDGTFRNDGPLPDWFYCEEFAFDVTGTQEQESRMFARAVSKLLSVPIQPSGLTAE